MGEKSWLALTLLEEQYAPNLRPFLKQLFKQIYILVDFLEAALVGCHTGAYRLRTCMARRAKSATASHSPRDCHHA